MSHSPYIYTPLQRTLHPTGTTIPDTYCIITLACNINPTIPQNIIQKFAAQFFGTDTSTAIDQCGILFYFLSPCTLLPHINITVLINGPTHWPCPLCTTSPSNVPNSRGLNRRGKLGGLAWKQGGMCENINEFPTKQRKNPQYTSEWGCVIMY